MKATVASRSNEVAFGMAQKLATAVHDAGHAVVGELLDFHCRHICGAFWQHDRRTSTLLRFWPNTQKAVRQHEDYAIASLAGVAVEAIDAGVNLITKNLRNGPGKADCVAVKAIAHKVSWPALNIQTLQPERSEASLIEDWEAKAIQLLSENWRWVESVAGVWLDSEGHVSGVEVRNCKGFN